MDNYQARMGVKLAADVGGSHPSAYGSFEDNSVRDGLPASQTSMSLAMLPTPQSTRLCTDQDLEALAGGVSIRKVSIRNTDEAFYQYAVNIMSKDGALIERK